MNDDSKIIYYSIMELPLQVLNEVEKEELYQFIYKIRKKYKTIIENRDDVYFYDNPDFFIEFDDSVLAIEHFMIDSSKLTSKGYKYKRKYSERYFKEAHSDIYDVNDSPKLSKHSFIVETDLKYKYLFNNFISIFSKHYENIERYKENISERIGISNKEIEIIFFIEYDILLPSTIFHNDNERAIFPHNDIRFYNYLENKDKIKGLIMNNGRENNESLINRYISINALKENEYKIDNKDVFDLSGVYIHDYKNPHYISTIIKG